MKFPPVISPKPYPLRRTFTIDYYIPIQNDDEISTKSRWNPIHTINTLISLSGDITFQLTDECVTPKISICKNNKKLKYVHNHFGIYAFAISAYSIIHIKIKTKNRNDTTSTPSLFQHNSVSNKNMQAIFETNDYLEMLLHAYNISHPGSITTLGSICFINNSLRIANLHPHIVNGKNLTILLEKYMHQQWPPIQTLDPQKMWTWVSSNHKTLYSNDTPLSRGISALFRILKPESSYTEELFLLWSMFGIESLFTDDSQHEESLMSQIKSKTDHLFGRCSTKNMIRDMYKMRSKFVHGKIGPAPLTNVENEDKIIDNYDQPLFEAASTATAILLATIQYVISKGWKNITFTKTLSVSE